MVLLLYLRWVENYKLFENLEFKNSFFDFSFLAKQYLKDKDGFRSYVNDQALLGIFLFLKAAKELIPSINYTQIEPSEKVGIRAQLFDLNKSNNKDFLCLMVKIVRIFLIPFHLLSQQVFL